MNDDQMNPVLADVYRNQFVESHQNWVLGLTLKIDDGATRGSQMAPGALLKKPGAIDSQLYRQLGAYFAPNILIPKIKSRGKLWHLQPGIVSSMRKFKERNRVYWALSTLCEDY